MAPESPSFVNGVSVDQVMAQKMGGDHALFLISVFMIVVGDYPGTREVPRFRPSMMRRKFLISFLAKRIYKQRKTRSGMTSKFLQA